MRLSQDRSAALHARLFELMSVAYLRAPRDNELETAYTRSVLTPIVIGELERLNGLPFKCRGDGTAVAPVPASALDVEFFPDVAVSLGSQHLWAAEVKVLRDTNRQSAIATAFGQAALYRSRYDHVTVVLVDTTLPTREGARRLNALSRKIGIPVVLRPRVGDALMAHSDAD